MTSSVVSFTMVDKPFRTATGVRQGCIISPILFLSESAVLTKVVKEFTKTMTRFDRLSSTWSFNKESWKLDSPLNAVRDGNFARFLVWNCFSFDQDTKKRKEMNFVLLSFVLAAFFRKSYGLICNGCEMSNSSQPCNFSYTCADSSKSCETLVSKIDNNYTVVFSCSSMDLCGMNSVNASLSKCNHSRWEIAFDAILASRL